jgi:tetratricopeptide (TPR) repeat protein
MAHWTPEKTLAARREFEKAAAEAWAGLAHVLMIDYLRGWNNPSDDNIQRANDALQKADAIDRSVALAHVARAKILEVDGKLEDEIKALDDALKLDPDLADAYAHKANALILLGRADQAPELLTEAIRLSPGDPELGLCYWFKGRAYFHLKDYDPAIHWLKKSVEVRPTTWFSWAHLISAYAHKERFGEAQAAVNEYRRIFRTDWPLDRIREYYKQPKYRRALPELQHLQREEAREAYFDGLEIAKEKADFP